MGEPVQPPRGKNKQGLSGINKRERQLAGDVRKKNGGLKKKEQQPPATTVQVDYKVDTGNYDGFITDFRGLLAEHKNPSKLDECHPVLPKQTSRHPARWMFVNLTCGREQEVTKTTLAIRDDNLYLKAFRNQKGKWYELGITGKHIKLLPAEYSSKFLECGDEYGSLAGGGKDYDKVKDNLLRLELGKGSMMRAVSNLARYEQGSFVGVDAVDPTPKRELAQLIVMICEPARMIKHYDTVRNGWKGLSQITELEVYYLWNWGNMSGALLECMRDTEYKWPDEEIFYGKPNIRNKDEALQVVHLVKNTCSPEKKREQQHHKSKKQKPPSPQPPADGDKDADGPPSQAPPPADNNKAVHGQPQLPSQPPSSVGGKQYEGEASSSQQVQATASTSLGNETAAGTRCCGRRLVEVFDLTVSAGSDADEEFPLRGTTIAVFDGKRGQIIYKHDKEEDYHTQDPKLVLTGPHTAISADRSFAVEIEIPTTTTANTTDDVPSTTCWEWDCSDDEIEYNELYTENLGPVHITYAVLSDALEATVEIKLHPLSGESLPVFGLIEAYIGTFAKPSVLFSRAKDKAVPLPSNSIVPLARSVIAVPSQSMVDIKVGLSTENPDRAVKNFFGTITFDCRVHSKTISTDNGDVQVNISWYPQFNECEEKRRSSPSETIRTDTDLVYNVVDGDYATFMTEFRALLADHPHSEDYEGNHVLARQSARQPGRWIHIKLVAGEETTTLAVRNDNVYLKGFRNKEGQWYELSGPTERSARMLPREYNSSLLGCCDVGYRSILGVDIDLQVLEKLTSVMLDKRFVIEAVRRLSGYREEVTVDAAVRLALAGLIIIVCESARMSKLYHTISRGLALSVWQVYYLWNWKRMSRALLQQKSSSNSIWPRHDPQLEPLGITSAHETLRIVELLLNWSLGARVAAVLGNGLGRQRVELLAVRAEFRLPAGTTITVFDGKRGQIIYRHQQADEHSSVLDYQGNMVLSGPYEAISADGCFAIHVEMPTAAQGSDGVGGAFVWEWDGYDQAYAGQVDSSIPSDHTINIGPGRTIHVAYAVMSNAVETTVQVSLPLAGGTPVYGQITAYIEGFERIVGSVLFSSTAANAVPVYPADSTVPLTRSVVALQYGKQLYIEMKLHTVTNQGSKDFEGAVTFKGGSSAEKLDTRHGTVRVNITWYPKFPAPRGCV